MRRISKLLFEPPDWKIAEDIKSRIVYLNQLNNLNVLHLWHMYIAMDTTPEKAQVEFYKVKDNIDNFHLWLNSDI